MVEKQIKSKGAVERTFATPPLGSPVQSGDTDGIQASARCQRPAVMCPRLVVDASQQVRDRAEFPEEMFDGAGYVTIVVPSFQTPEIQTWKRNLFLS
jgi:hypothetical protein